jgi:DUF1680 family protein
MGESLTRTHASFETPCGAYGHFKITRNLLRITRDSRYGDSMERVMYNTILGAKPLLEDGSSFYYSDYNHIFAMKGYHRDKWPCCSGTFPQITADYGISSYFRDAGGVYVNLYVPSRVKWTRGQTRISLVQQTDFPVRPETQIEIQTDSPQSFVVHLRIPAWAGPKTAITVNGRKVEGDLTPGQFAAIDRTWKNGDRIEAEFDMTMALERVDEQHPDIVAPVFGPLALFALGRPDFALRREDLLAASRAADGSDSWKVEAATGEILLKPFMAIQDEQYRLYHSVAS